MKRTDDGWKSADAPLMWSRAIHTLPFCWDACVRVYWDDLCSWRVLRSSIHSCSSLWAFGLLLWPCILFHHFPSASFQRKKLVSWNHAVLSSTCLIGNRHSESDMGCWREGERRVFTSWQHPCYASSSVHPPVIRGISVWIFILVCQFLLQRIASIFTGHDLNDFIDVCSIANISVFILDVPCHFCIFFVLDISLSYFVLNQPTLKSELDNSRVDICHFHFHFHCMRHVHPTRMLRRIASVPLQALT